MKKQQVEVAVFLGLLAVLGLIIVLKGWFGGGDDVSNVSNSVRHSDVAASARHPELGGGVPSGRSNMTAGGRSLVPRIKISEKFISAYIQWGRDPFSFGQESGTSGAEKPRRQ